MRIDIGPEGKIVGTKRVSANGHVEGLNAWADKDILIVVPEGRAQFRFGPADYVAEFQKLATRNLKKAQKQWKKVRATIPTPEAALKIAKKELKPARLQKRFGKWVDARTLFEDGVANVRKQKRVKAAERWIKTRMHAVDAVVRPAAN